MPTVLITGASGFVGHHLVQRLQQNARIIGFTNTNPGPSSGDVVYEKGDITDSQRLTEVVAKYKPDQIVHLAAKTHDWFDDPQNTFQINTVGTVNLYEAVLTVKGSHPDYDPKILYVGTSEAYGRTINPASIHEDAPLRPANHYAASKAAADVISYSYSQSHKLRIVIARPFTHTGPGQSAHSFASSMAAQISKLEQAGGGTLHVGHLGAVRDYLDVRDVVEAYELLLQCDVIRGEVFNICSAKPVVVNGILDELLAMSNVEISAELDPARVRPSDTPMFVGNNDKLRRVTGWKPQYDRSRTLADLLQYWRAQSAARDD